MDLPEMRDLVEADLHDSSNDIWSAAEIDRHIGHAVQEFSYQVPDEDTSTEASLVSRDIDISGLTGLVSIQAVEYPEGNYPATYTRFSVWGDTLTVLVDTGPDGTYDAKIYYGKMHVLDGSGSTIPTMHEHLITLGAAGFALSEIAAYTINKTNVGGEKVAEAYRRSGQEKLTRFRAEIIRLGRNNRVRIRQLYTPYYAPVSKYIVEGP